MAFEPIPCIACGGGGGGVGPPTFDSEQQLLCDVGPDGELFGTAMMVTVYPEDGSTPSAPQPVNPVDGTPYVAQGTLQPCPGDTGCLEPVPFHFTTTTTAPVDHPGRQYDIDLPINPGFAVQSLQVDAVNSAANIVWDVADPDGEQFRQDLTAFIEARVPASATVTITNPNAGNTICGTAAPMQVHIECVRLDQAPPDLIELIYNGGQDMVINPAYNETPPLSPPVSQGNYGFRLLSRQDDPGPFPGNQPANDANCTDVANRGWETNDTGRTFEIWGQDIVNGSNVTPTPRGTPVQEITSDGPPPGQRSTIWQTFQAPATGNFVIRVVHGARDAGENHIITLDNGDTDAAQNGDLINDVTNPGVVTNSPGGPGPWTTFSQTIPLTAGNVYTLALSTNNPNGGARGGLFTDMRAYIDRPDLRATAATDDDTCVVTVDETVTVCEDQYWAPQCSGGQIVSWQNSETEQVLENAAFWGQAPSPEPGNCPATAAGGGGSVSANLVHTYTVCAQVGGVPTSLQRVVITDPSGGVLAEQFIGQDGGPVSPASYTIGACGSAFEDAVMCYTTVGDPIPRQGYRREVFGSGGTSLVVFLGDNGAQVIPDFWRPGACPDRLETREVLCDQGNDNHSFIRTYTNPTGEVTPVDTELDGVTLYAPVGPVGPCGPCGGTVLGDVCVSSDAFPGVVVHATAVRACDGTVSYLNPATGDPWPGVLTVVVCPAENALSEEILCDGGNGGAQFRRIYTLTAIGSVVQYDETLDGTLYVVVGPIVQCGPTDDPGRDVEQAVLCDNNGPFLRVYQYGDDTGTPSGAPADFTLAGAPYVAVGPVVICGPTTAYDSRDAELLVLCDSTAPTPVRFLRKYLYDGETGAATAFVNTTLDGTTPYAPVGAVQVCSVAVQSDFDFLATVLCDANGTQFIQRLTFNSATGAVTATTNTTLTGAAFAPVAPVALCTSCCPIEIGQGCYNAGSGRYTALRLPNGTISLIDSVTGAAVLAANIIPCVTDDTAVVQSSEARLLAATQAWTPGADLVGTLTGLTFQVLTGTASLVDTSGTAVAGIPAGTSVSWNVEDNNTLQAPQSITADAASTVLVSWTRK